VLEIPGFAGARRFERAPATCLPPGSEIENRYLALYDLDTDPKTALDALLERRANETIVVPSFVKASRKLGIFEALGPRVAAG
jgi:hypothetical protein